MAQEPDRPERAWLSASGARAARQAARALHDAWQAVARAETDASAYYTPARARREDVEGLARRFDSGHQALGKLSGDYRADKKTVASFTRDGVGKDDAQQHLRLAVTWKQAADALAAAETAHAATLGAVLRRPRPRTGASSAGRSPSRPPPSVPLGGRIWAAPPISSGVTRLRTRPSPASRTTPLRI